MDDTVCPSLIVGLGNPGEEYADTRHNVGFKVIDKILAGKKPASSPPEHFSESVLCFFRSKGRQVFLQKPLTYMNLSGMPVAKFCREKGIEPHQILLIFDDVDLPLGKIRIRMKGGSGGHRGVDSVIAALNSDSFNRMRIGIGRATTEDSKTSDHVLSSFTADEQPVLEKVIAGAAEAVLLAVNRGVEATMNSYNGIPFDGGGEESSPVSC